MIIVYNGNPFSLEEIMRKWSGQSEDSTADFIQQYFKFYVDLEVDFKIMKGKVNVEESLEKEKVKK